MVVVSLFIDDLWRGDGLLLNKSDMASSIGISVQAFDKWGVPPVERRGREVFMTLKLYWR